MKSQPWEGNGGAPQVAAFGCCAMQLVQMIAVCGTGFWAATEAAPDEGCAPPTVDVAADA